MTNLDFDPNDKKPPEFPLWATYIPKRTTGPKFKTHKTRGHVLNALASREGIAYIWENEEWKEVYRCEDASDFTQTCPICGTSLMHTTWRWKPGSNFKEREDYEYMTGQWVWTNKNDLFPIPIRICYSYHCRRKAEKL